MTLELGRSKELGNLSHPCRNSSCADTRSADFAAGELPDSNLPKIEVSTPASAPLVVAPAAVAEPSAGNLPTSRASLLQRVKRGLDEFILDKLEEPSGKGGKIGAVLDYISRNEHPLTSVLAGSAAGIIAALNGAPGAGVATAFGVTANAVITPLLYEDFFTNRSSRPIPHVERLYPPNLGWRALNLLGASLTALASAAYVVPKLVVRGVEGILGSLAPDAPAPVRIRVEE